MDYIKNFYKKKIINKVIKYEFLCKNKKYNYNK